MASHLYVTPKGDETLNNRLADVRRIRGVTQDQLADALDVSRQTISSIENGRYNPSIVVAFRLARFFEMAIEQIFIYEE